MCGSLTGQPGWQVNSHTPQNALPHLQPLVVWKENRLVQEATSKGFTHLSTWVQANSNCLEWTDSMATQKGFVKLCFLTLKRTKHGKSSMLPSAQKKRHLPDHPHNFPLFAPRDADPAPSCQPATGATGLPGRAAPHLQTSDQLKSAPVCWGQEGEGTFPFSHIHPHPLRWRKKSRFKYQVQHGPFPK